MSAAPIEHLEHLASEQRERLHQAALELRSKVDDTKQHFSPVNILHRNFERTSAAVSVVAFVAGYLFAGAFTHR
jgi:hypothetical protein